ncbi:Hypothetical predicted protein [Mytilus galloprovincialis]|uniref:Major facilitator superfamily (MFS) profile domain-containing protein n=1 Tax=Mytilus galloprovincialis TaxID=29158 RepID=A0A8B6FGS6_MYTGA|nr:Hypothetical predicted protein [Mytilus galloprovincialis]
MLKDKETTDGCYAWIVLFACTVLQFLTDSILKSFGLFYVEIIDEFQESVSFTSLITGIMFGVYCLSTLPVMMYLIKAIQPRGVMIIGSVLIAAGYSLSCLAPNIYFLLFSISILVGVGMACIFPPSIYALGTYFTKRRATANGIAISGCSLGALVSPPLYQYLIKTYGLRGSLLVTGAILLNNLPMAFLLRTPNKVEQSEKAHRSPLINKKDPVQEMKPTKTLNGDIHTNNFHFINGYTSMSKRIHKSNHNGIGLFSSHPQLSTNLELELEVKVPNMDENKSNSDEHLNGKTFYREFPLSSFKYFSSSALILYPILVESEDSINENESSVKLNDSVTNPVCNLLKKPTFLIFLLANSLSTIVASTFLSFLPLHAKQNNINEAKMVILVSLTGAVDLIGRILCGILADRSHVQSYQILVVSQLICGVTYNCNQFMTSFSGLVVFCVLIGLFSGMFLPLRHSIMVDISGIALYPTALAITTVSQLPIYVAGPLAFGILRDINGNFIASYHLIGVVALLSGVLFLCGPLLKRCQKNVPCEEGHNTQTT